MKKLLAVIAACLVLCGCGSKGGEQHSEMDCSTLKVFNTGEYIDTSRITAFEKI